MRGGLLVGVDGSSKAALGLGPIDDFGEWW